MATIRTAASAGAALFALVALVPTTSQAQGPGAPLELVPGSNQAKAPQTRSTQPKANQAKANHAKANPNRPTQRTTTHSKKAATPVAKAPAQPTATTAARPPARPNTAATQPAPKTARAHARKATRSVASGRLETGPHAPLARFAYPQPVIQQAVVPYLAMARPVLRRGTRLPPIIARGPSAEPPQDRVMRGRSTISLLAMLPWWRNTQDSTDASTQTESKVLQAAAVWIAANGATEGDSVASAPQARASANEAIDLADAGEVNAIDRAAQPAPSAPSPIFLQSLLALIGGAVAAALAAASARLMFRVA